MTEFGPGNPSSLRIDPGELSLAANDVRSRADQADQLSTDVQVALERAVLKLGIENKLREIDEELTLLAEILDERAQLAQSFWLQLPVACSPLTTELWTSLIDADGAKALVAGDTALDLLASGFESADHDDDDRVSVGELELIALNPAEFGPLSAAAAALLMNPRTVDLLFATSANSPFEAGWEQTISPAGIAQLVADNQKLRLSAPNAAEALSAGDPYVSIDGLPEDPMDVVIEAINRGIFGHDSLAARTFLASLPNAADGVPTLPIFSIETVAANTLYEAAMAGIPASDLLSRFSIVTQMPETPDGIRNAKITELYALAAKGVDELTNPSQVGDPTLLGHAGATWLHWGASASNTVGGGISGTTKLFGIVPPTDDARQHMADGNQLIATTVLGHYFEFLSQFEGGEVTDEKVADFLNTFKPGEGDLQIAFAHQLASMLEDDPDLRQHLQLESNIGVATHEQAVVDNHLNFNNIEMTAQVGAHVLSALLAHPPFSSSKSSAEMFTAEGTLDLHQDDGDVVSFELDYPVPEGPTKNNLVANLDPTDESNPSTFGLDQIDLGGLGHVEEQSRIQELTQLSADYDDWIADRPTIEAEDWTDYSDRMPQIIDLMQKHHVNPQVFVAVDVILDASD